MSTELYKNDIGTATRGDNGDVTIKLKVTKIQDQGPAEQFGELLFKAIEGVDNNQGGFADRLNKRSFVIDLDGVTELNGAALGKLMTAQSRTKGVGLEFRLDNVSEELLSQFKPTNLDRLFGVAKGVSGQAQGALR